MFFASLQRTVLRTARAAIAALGGLLFLSFFIAAALAAPSAVAKPEPQAQQNADESALVTMNMRDADIRAVIQWIAEQTHRQIVIDPRVQGRVTAFADRPMTVAQAYQVFLSLLEVQGYSSSDIDGILRIYPSALAKVSPRAVVDNFDKLESSGQVMYVVSLQNVSNRAMMQLIKPLVSPTGYIAPLESSDSLLIADDSDNVKRLVELIHRLDRTGSLDIEVIKLQHASAKDVAQLLAGLDKSSKGSSNTTSGDRESPLSIAADERSNSVLLAGDPSGRQRAEQLIRQLDQPLRAANASRVVFLHYLSAEELLPILKSTTGNAQKESKEEALKEAAISIEASKSNNAIVMTGPPDLLDNMQSIISKLDVQRAQVLVEALIVEVSGDAENDLGVLWSTANVADLKGSGGVAAVGALGNLPLAGTTTALDASGNAIQAPAPGNGLTLGYYTGGTLQSAIRALSSNTKAKVLSTPSVMTLDNQQAQIMVGSNIPIITGQSTSEASSTQTPFTTYQREDIGITLKITPQINSDKSVQLDIVQEVQTVANTANTALSSASDIVTNKRSIRTKVVIKNDRTLVLGGLISNELGSVDNKVPILGDMPLIGRLFRSTSTTTTKENLMVFIHPVVIDSDAMANKVSRENYNEMRVRQMKYENGKLEPTEPAPSPEFEKILPQRGANHSSTIPAPE